MAGRPHEVLVAAMHESPDLVNALVVALRGVDLPEGLEPVDSTVRFVKTAEVRPDVLFAKDRGPWAIVELQRKIDPDKRRRWLLAAGILLDQTGVLGDLLVITARRSVARWARTVAHVVTKLGTKLALTPVVLRLGPNEVQKLLDPAHPELALFAAWAMHHRHGPKARAVIEEAIELTERMPEPLREAQIRAILSMLSSRMLAAFVEDPMRLADIPESNAVKRARRILEERGREKWLAEGKLEGEITGEIKGKLEGKLEGMREALMTLLSARKLAVSKAQRATIEACTDVGQIEQWIVRGATAGSVREVLDAGRA